MDGYRQTLLGRALADALRELEEESDALEVDGDLLFSLFDVAMQAELGRETPFTHESVELTGQLTAFNRFLDDWSVQARALPQDIRLNHCVADLHLPQQQGQEKDGEGEQAVAVRLKLRRRT
ncbi:hypothetical protein PF005_g17274 [Phytophthora fragariae]|uniref:Uncharacterized protein n=2 Tax=Phytophthora TaxID=4783 RepID=A0A6A4CU67_9STRA|nr:hypothetical protein PF003_g23054 [Phytophthora fragariae]KAE9005810.1 hypothetical protein PR002_g16662 [Phytophthora rubi]KAE8931436.1 hypothetical protein PF009_g18508 [Phytophthora fragariae]KAE8996828.1 hypothetical protein PF011_g15745 [Phytophthora fragariae]KAE9009129.1 hypothetical protein PR001_g16520 [Phytophthora rubi]